MDNNVIRYIYVYLIDYHLVGASSGIGKSTAVHFVELGASVSLTGRNKANLEETAKLCNAASTGDQKVNLQEYLMLNLDSL